MLVSRINVSLHVCCCRWKLPSFIACSLLPAGLSRACCWDLLSTAAYCALRTAPSSSFIILPQRVCSWSSSFTILPIRAYSKPLAVAHACFRCVPAFILLTQRVRFWIWSSIILPIRAYSTLSSATPARSRMPAVRTPLVCPGSLWNATFGCLSYGTKSKPGPSSCLLYTSPSPRDRG